MHAASSDAAHTAAAIAPAPPRRRIATNRAHAARQPSAACSDAFHSPDDIVILPKSKRRILGMRHCQIVAKAAPLVEAGRCRGGS
ncbi:hypothetical protein [Mitsuaria sp. TWR114]|uniref:hypothetical protein n=1 Tax=Mitsuaria sp. TWR114 TaxID=2601731 RepID=UPI001C9BBC61|nr:hypothetical protein [Mitsuaria sp. TWR114]